MNNALLEAYNIKKYPVCERNFSEGITLNPNGFRGATFSNVDDYILTLGCSLTYGVSLVENKTWPYILSQYLNVPDYINLAIRGGSMDTITSVFLKFIEKKKDNAKYCFALFPHPSRRTIYKDGKYFDGRFYGKSFFTKKIIWSEDKSLSTILDFPNIEQDFDTFFKNYNIIKYACASKGIDLLWSTWTFIPELNITNSSSIAEYKDLFLQMADKNFVDITEYMKKNSLSYTHLSETDYHPDASFQKIVTKMFIEEVELRKSLEQK